MQTEMTEQQMADVLKAAYEMGESSHGGSTDWDDVFNRLERYCDCLLPDDYSHPFCNKVKRTYRKGYSENN